MYLLHKEGGYRAQDALWQLRRNGTVVLHQLSDAEGDRMDTLMRQYQVIPMDAADASLVAIAESLNIHRIFTIDGHFRAYRINNTGVFDVVP